MQVNMCLYTFTSVTYGQPPEDSCAPASLPSPSEIPPRWFSSFSHPPYNYEQKFNTATRSDTSKLRHQCIILPSLPAPFHRTKTTPTTLTNSISPRGSFPSKIKLPARLAGLSSLLPLRAAPHARERLCIPPGLSPASPERCCHLVPRHHRTVPTGCESPARPRVRLHRTLGAASRGAGTLPAHSAGAGSVPALLAAARVCRTLSAVSSCCSYCGMMVKRGEPLNLPGAYSPNG